MVPLAPLPDRPFAPVSRAHVVHARAWCNDHIVVAVNLSVARVVTSTEASIDTTDADAASINT